MKKFTSVLCSVLAVYGLSFATANAQEDAKALVDAMTEAHGGLDQWMAAPSHELTVAMVLNSLPLADGRTAHDNWRYYTVTVEPKTSNTLVDVPWEATDGPEQAVTSDLIWRRPLAFDPTFQEPPLMLAWYHFGMVNLPFLIQDESVRLRMTDGLEHPFTGSALVGVEATFEPGEGKIHEGSITLYIDPETNRLAAWRLGTMFPPLPGDILPSPVPVPAGSPLRVVEEYADYDGFILPRAYASLTPDGNVGGTHVILSASSNKPFDGSLLKPPADAETIIERDNR